MNYIFKELFEKLHDKECINEYKDLIEFEKDLDSLIQEKMQKSLWNIITDYCKMQKVPILYSNDTIINFKQWYFGHYHINREFKNGKYVCLYQEIRPLL